MKINEIKSKTILTESKLPEVDYCVNPYVGCAHSCLYCYARFMKKFTNHNNDVWGEFVDVKINALELLKKKLSKHPEEGIILLGSVTDAYQPIEKKHKITRSILEIILKYQYPLSVLTKSDLVTRDIDIFKKIDKCEVGLTVTLSNDDCLKIIEPRASSFQKRIRALEKLKEAGIRTYAFVGPILPKLTDLEKIFKALSGKIDFVMAETLNTKFGNWDEFVQIISTHFPDIANFYEMGFNKLYWDEKENEVRKLSKKYNIKLKGFYRH